ncbi:MAG: type III secretion system cytoplasmic ring protein SctQ [Burkholderiaceae bacterium]
MESVLKVQRVLGDGVHSPIRLRPIDAAFVRCTTRYLDGSDLESSAGRLSWIHDPGNWQFHGLLCHCPHGRFWLSMSDWSRLDQTLVPGIEHLPDDVQLALIEQAAAPVLETLQACFGWPISVRRYCGSPASDELTRLPDSVVGFGVSWLSGDQSEPLVGLIRAGLTVWEAGAVPGPVEQRSSLPVNVPLQLPIEAGRTNLLVSEIDALEVGDLVRLQPAVTVDVTLPVLLRTHASRAIGVRGQIRGRQFIVETIVNTSVNSDSIPEQDTQSVPVDPMSINCQVVAEVGKLELSVAQLTALTPGQVIELGESASTVSVSLRVQGQLVAEGELVSVGDELAIAITRKAAQS